MKKIICIFTALFLTLVLFASCSDDKGDLTSYGSAMTVSYGDLLAEETSID